MTREELKDLRELWQQRVEEFENSGQAATVWCREKELKVNQLRYWRRKFNKVASTTTPATTNSLQWQPIEIGQHEASESKIEIRVGKATIEAKSGFNKKLLQDLVEALTELC